MNTSIKKTLSQSLKAGKTYLMEHESKEILAGAGIATTVVTVAHTAVEAVEISERIGYPVVLKVLSPQVIHKSDRGGVRINLTDSREVTRAFWEITAAFANEDIIGIAVQKMAAPGLEAIIGVKRDPIFGQVLMFGLGGIFVEVLQDITFRILPITETDIDKMLLEIRGYRLLAGYRGTTVDLPALKELLLQVTQLVQLHPEIMEIELNPVFLYPQGNITIDARIFLKETGETDAFKTPPGKVCSQDILHKLFYPNSIAILGASDTPGKLGWNIFHNLLHHGFAGQLYPVNTKTETVQGVPAFTSVELIPGPVDAAVIMVPAAYTLQAFESCCRKGIQMIVIESAGFAETGDSGKNLEKELQRLAAEYNCRFVGPNCSGIINTHSNVVQSIALVEKMDAGNIALIGQAGFYVAGMLRGMKHMGFATVATIGNKADINETDILEYLGDDQNIDVICMYLEDIKSGVRFIDTARKITAHKPIIILKSGRTEAGKKAVTSHTASLAGNDEVYSAAFRQAGVIRVWDNDHMFGLAKAFAKQPIPKGDGVLVMTYTGSQGVAATDSLSLNGMRLAQLDEKTYKSLRAIIPPHVACNNPADYTFEMNPVQVRKTIEAGLLCDDIGSFVIVIQAELLTDYLREYQKIDLQGKTLLCCVPSKEFYMDEIIIMEKAGFPTYSTPEETVRALAAMYHYGQRQKA